MRLKTAVSFSTLAGFVATLAIGCGPSTEVQLAPAPPAAPTKIEPLPKDVMKGGGPGSSGNMKRDPNAEIVK
jgi:hypothetical protein